jgi:hypothetical protein
MSHFSRSEQSNIHPLFIHTYFHIIALNKASKDALFQSGTKFTFTVIINLNTITILEIQDILLKYLQNFDKSSNKSQSYKIKFVLRKSYLVL